MPAKPTNTTLSSLTSAALSNLSTCCGLPKSGTKAVLRLRLQQAAQSYQPINNTTRILSIDLGLKNFAFSLFSPSNSPPASPSLSSLLINDTSPSSPILPQITLHVWNRLDLTANLPPSFSFSPSEMASLTINLTITHLLPLNPTHILIERQRFRTNNAASILEWTVRVNTLEAMLHAVFKLLSTSSSSTPVREVSSVFPKLVAGYLFPSAEDALLNKNDKRVTAQRLLKQNKVEMLGKQLAEDKLVVAGNQVLESMIRNFVEAWRTKGQRQKKKKEAGSEEIKEMVGKLDDLSDSVLQGMVWLQWNRNLKGVMDAFPELLEEMDEEQLAELVAKKPAKRSRRKAKTEEIMEDGEQAVAKKKSSTSREKGVFLEEEQVDIVFEDDVVVKTPKKSRKKKDAVVEVDPEASAKGEDDIAVKTPKRSRKKKDVAVEAEPGSSAEDFQGATVSLAVETPGTRSRKKDTVVKVEPATPMDGVEEEAAGVFVDIPIKRSRKKKDAVAEIQPETSLESIQEEVAELVKVLAKRMRKMKTPLTEEAAALEETELEATGVLIKTPTKRSRTRKSEIVQVHLGASSVTEAQE